MKKLLILILIIPFFSCETNTIEIEKTAGEWYRGGWKGKKFQFLMTNMLTWQKSLWMLMKIWIQKRWLK